MGRKTHSKRKPQSSKDPLERRRAAMAASAALAPPDKAPGLLRDQPPPTPNGPVFGSGRKHGVTGGQRGAVRPKGAIRVSPYIDETRTKASAAHDGFHGAGKDPNPPRTTFVRSRKGGVSDARVKPHAPVDACPVCWHEEATLARIGDRPMDPVTPLRACREHYAPRERTVIAEVDTRGPVRPGRVRIDVPVDKRYADELPTAIPVPGPVPPPSRLDGATTEQIEAWSREHGEAWRAAADWRSRYAQ